MIARVPDFFEPIVAYRGWNVDAKGFLKSANEGRRWKARKAVRAICTNHADGEAHWHPETGATLPAPCAGCTCGYYAYKIEPAVDEYHSRVRGSVHLWGRIIEHAKGYRAEFAYPFKLRCGSDKLAARLRHLYGVECVVDEAMRPKTMTDKETGISIQFLAQSQWYQSQFLTPAAAGLIGSTTNLNIPQCDWNDGHPGGGKTTSLMKIATDEDVKSFSLPTPPSTWKELIRMVLK